MRVQAFCVVVLLATLAWARPVQAAESYDNCTGFITSLPAVINSPGTWCFNNDLSTAITSGDAITITTNNVTIDCNDFKLGGLAAGPATAALGIYSNSHLNSIVRHCNIRGFFRGLYFSGSGGGHIVEDNRFDGNTYDGLYVQGDGSVVRRNQVFDTGGTTLNTIAFGIETHDSVDVLDNTVSGVLATAGGNGTVYGIYMDTNTSGRAIGNGVRGLVKDGTGVVKGIYNTSSGRLTIRSNDLVGDGGIGSVGITCNTAQGSAKDNVINGFATAIQTCVDAGGNYSIP